MQGMSLALYPDKPGSAVTIDMNSRAICKKDVQFCAAERDT